MPLDLASRRVLVTGGSGFLGRRVVAYLEERGCSTPFVPRSADYDLVDHDAVTIRLPKRSSTVPSRTFANTSARRVCSGASTALLRHHASDADAARVLAVLNAAATDAIIACFDAKYHYWTIRPSQADSTIALADSVELPNFPSYPSGHACSAGAFDAVLGHYFPQDRAEFTRIAEEQAMSRLWGGIHYRFDDDEGLALGRVVARYGVEQERRGRLSAWRAAR